MINAEHLLTYVVRPTLHTIGHHSVAREQLLLGTCAKESAMGTYLHQIGGGPALGIFQTEPDTHRDVWLNWLRFRGNDFALMKRMVASSFWDDAAGRPRHQALICDMSYATAIASHIYRRASDPLPRQDDWMAMAAYWKRFYNRGGKGSEGDFIAACEAAGVTKLRMLTGATGE